MAGLQVNIDGPKVAEGAKDPAADRETTREEYHSGDSHSQMERPPGGEDLDDAPEAEPQEHDGERDGGPVGPAPGDVAVIPPDFDSALQQAYGGEGEKRVARHDGGLRIWGSTKKAALGGGEYLQRPWLVGRGALRAGESMLPRWQDVKAGELNLPAQVTACYRNSPSAVRPPS